MKTTMYAIISLWWMLSGCAGVAVGGWDTPQACGSGVCGTDGALQSPLIVKKTVLSGSEVRITWEQPGAVKALSYRVYIGLPNNGGYMRELPDQLGSEARTFVFDGLSIHTTYLVKVVAFVPGMPEAPSEVVEIMSYHLLPPPPSSTVDRPGYTPKAFDGRAYLCMPAPNDNDAGVCALPYGQQAEYAKLNPALDGSVQNIASTCSEASLKSVRLVLVSLAKPNEAAALSVSQFSYLGGFSPAGLVKTTVSCRSGQWIALHPEARYVRVDGVPVGGMIDVALLTWDPAVPQQFVIRKPFPQAVDVATKDKVPFSADLADP